MIAHALNEDVSFVEEVKHQRRKGLKAKPLQQVAMRSTTR